MRRDNPPSASRSCNKTHNKATKKQGREPVDTAANAARFGDTIAPQSSGSADLIAFDRSSVRRIDGDGHLFIKVAPIAKANIYGYRGSELPGHETFGLDPARIYQLFRDPAELEEAAPTFRGKPVLSVHRCQRLRRREPQHVGPGSTRFGNTGAVQPLPSA